MIISYISGIELLHKNYKRIEEGDVRQIIFFLGTNTDDDFLESLVNSYIDLHYLSGDNVLCVSFMPPKKGMMYESLETRSRAFVQNSDDPEFIMAMSQNSYELASFFGIEYSKLPCILFVNPANKEEFTFLRVHEKNISDVFKGLRSLFYNWYSENYVQFKVNKAVNKDSIGHYRSDVQHIIHEILKRKLLPSLSDSILAFYDGKGLNKRKVINCLKELNNDPRKYSNLESYLKTKPNFEFYVNGIKFNSGNFSNDYSEAAKKIVKSEYIVPDFPVEHLKNFKSVTEIRRLSNSIFGKFIRLKGLEFELAKMFKFGINFGD